MTIDPVDLYSYYKVADRIPEFSASKYTIVEKCTDSGGGIWYKIEWEDPEWSVKYHELARIGKSGATLEFVDQQATQGVAN